MHGHDWISALDLQQWAASTDAKLLMPQLMRRLVHATIQPVDLERVEFPKGEQVYRPGFDGVTKAKSGNFKVPSGITNWEIGTGSHVKTKLDDDYQKRIDNRGEGEFKEVTYIAVTPYSYRDKAAWVAEKNATGDWAEVRLYDSDDLEQWLEQAPSVAVWFSQLIGKTTDGVSDLSARWTILQACLKRPLPASLLLIGRDQTQQAFRRWVDSPADTLKMVGHSPHEVVDVLAAWVESLPSDAQAPIASRCLIAEKPEAWASLVASVNPLILIASEVLEIDEKLIGMARGKGHHVLIPSVNISGGKNTLRMERLNRSELGTKLVEVGLTEQEAYTLARQSGGSFTVFKRLFSSSEEIKTPKWGEPAMAGFVAPLSLMGAWHDANKADQEIVARMVGKLYGDCLLIPNQLRKNPDSPIRLTAGIWEFVSPLDAWAFLHHSLTSAVLDQFETIAEEVLTTDNPAYDLPKEERWQANVKGKAAKYSFELRQGLAQSLAVIATQATPDEMANSVPLHDRACRVVEKILPAGASWRRWASLGSILPLLAEASPAAFLKAVENDLRSDAPEIPLLFAEELSGITGRAEHTGVLWALERLSWSKIHVANASELLAQLSEKDPGGKWANRPQASLRDVFFSWMPFTAAPLEQRLTLIRGIVKRHPDVGWKLLLDLLPKVSDSIGKNSPPEWNFWAEEWKPEVSEADYAKTVSSVVDMILSVLDARPDRWVEVIRPLDFLNLEDHERVLGGLEKLELSALPGEQRSDLWKAINGRLKHYRYYPGGRWNPTQDTINRLEKVCASLQPTDLIETTAPLFGNGFEMFGARDLPWEEQEKIRQKQRALGVQQVLDERGLAGVLELAKKAANAWGAGISLAEIDEAKFLPEIVPGLLTQTDRKLADFASAYLACLNAAKGREWAVANIRNDWSPEEFGAVSVWLMFDPETWAFIATQSPEKKAAYWANVRPRPTGLKPEDIIQSTKLLLESNRVHSAIGFLAASTYAKNAPLAHPLFDLLELALNTAFGPDTAQADPHDLHAILEVVYSVSDIDEVRLTAIEWILLPILDRHSLLPHGLHRLLAREPKHFVELLTLLFRDERKSDQELEAERQADNEDEDSPRAQKGKNAWHLLHDFATIPGGDENGKVAEEKLRAWVTTAREMAKAEGRLKVCDSAIGQIFAKCGDEEDGSWPLTPVGEIIEEVGSDELTNGFFVGVLNRRGATWRSVLTGGDTTRELAKEWLDRSEKCKAKWPKVSSALSAVAESYNRQAASEDQDAERRR